MSSLVRPPPPSGPSGFMLWGTLVDLRLSSPRITAVSRIGPRVRIGAAEDNDLVLGGSGVAPHAIEVRREDRGVVVDGAAESPDVLPIVDGRRQPGPVVVGPESLVTVGHFLLGDLRVQVPGDPVRRVRIPGKGRCPECGATYRHARSCPLDGLALEPVLESTEELELDGTIGAYDLGRMIAARGRLMAFCALYPKSHNRLWLRLLRRPRQRELDEFLDDAKRYERTRSDTDPSLSSCGYMQGAAIAVLVARDRVRPDWLVSECLAPR